MKIFYLKNAESFTLPVTCKCYLYVTHLLREEMVFPGHVEKHEMKWRVLPPGNCEMKGKVDPLA